MVAPHVGAWIETPNLCETFNGYDGRPPCGGVD